MKKNVRFALDNFPLKLEPQTPYLGQHGIQWKLDQTMKTLGIQEGLTWEESKLVQRFDPCISDSIGFFIAKFIKTKK